MDFISIPEAATLLTGSLEDCGVWEGFEKRKFPGAGEDGSNLKVATPLLLPPRGGANIRPPLGKAGDDETETALLLGEALRRDD